MSSYADGLTSHLAEYRRRTLGILEPGAWSRNGRSYAHILPAAERDLNLVAPIRQECLKYLERTRIRLHRDFHHLTSSQAFAFNLFFPLLSAGGSHADRVAEGLGFVGARITGWKFETVLCRHEGTNFDLVLWLADDRRLCVEVKLTEREFGGARPDAVHVARRDVLYLPRLRGKVDPELLGEPFFKHYQLLRNLSYVEPGETELVLFYPGRNRSVDTVADRFVSENVLPAFRPLVHMVHAERFAEHLLARPPAGEIWRAALLETARKYQLTSVSVEPTPGA